MHATDCRQFMLTFRGVLTMMTGFIWISYENDGVNDPGNDVKLSVSRNKAAHILVVLQVGPWSSQTEVKGKIGYNHIVIMKLSVFISC